MELLYSMQTAGPLELKWGWCRSRKRRKVIGNSPNIPIPPVGQKYLGE